MRSARFAWWLAAACIGCVQLAAAPTSAQNQVEGIEKSEGSSQAPESKTEDIEKSEGSNKAPESKTESIEEGPSDDDDEVTQEELDEAAIAIAEAEKQLEEAKRQMQLMGRKLAADSKPAPGTGVGLVASDGRAKKLQVSLNEDGTLYFRFATWLQVWTRAMQLNPGTTVVGKQDNWYADVGIRRARFLAFGQIFPRTFILMHIGINNQTFRNARKPQLFFHDAWAEFQVTKNNKLYIGGGLLYWNGVSRMTNASTITSMSLDLPISNWPTIELSDQFARQLGVYAKGKFGLFDYRIAAVRPFTAFDIDNPVQGPPNITGPCCGASGQYRDDANTWGYSGYFMFQFLDLESNVLPYTVSTYIGAKRVFNFGFGFHAQPRAIGYDTDPDPDVVSLKSRALYIASADLFLDMPFKGKDKGAATWYWVYWRQDFGPNNLRYIGIMNPGDAGSGIPSPGSGRGNQYPTIGTGHTGYTELGILAPGKLGDEVQLQPYVNYQVSDFEALQDIMHHVGIGLNVFVHRHNAKVTLEYRNRPIYNPDGRVESRKGNSFVLQMHLFI